MAFSIELDRVNMDNAIRYLTELRIPALEELREALTEARDAQAPQAWAVMVGDKVDGIIRTPDAKQRAEAKVAELMARGVSARAEPYRGEVRKKFGVTTAADADVLQLIPDARNNLSISRDTGFNDEPIAVMLYVPDMDKSDHEHLELNMDACRMLHGWLGRFIRLVDRDPNLVEEGPHPL